MTIARQHRRRLLAALAVLVLAASLVLAQGPTAARAASWTTLATGWSGGRAPAVALAAMTGATPDSLRFQVTNQAAKARAVDVAWTRSCWDKRGTLLESTGDYRVRIEPARTHTRTIAVPTSAVTCFLSVVTLVDVTLPANTASGRLTVKLQARY